MAYIGNDPFLSSQRQVTDFTATAGQDTFTPAGGYQLGYVDVYQNGILLVDGTDYTASNGTTVVLTEAASADDSIKLVTYVPRGLTDGYTKAEADALIDAIPEATPTQVSDQDNTSTGYFDLPSGTTAQRPSSPNTGHIRYNTDLGFAEQYTVDGWQGIAPPPQISTVSPTTFNGEAGTIFTISGANFDSLVNVKFRTSGGALVSAGTVTRVSQSQITATTPQDYTVDDEPLDVVVVNGSGLSVELSDSIDCGGTPIFSATNTNIVCYDVMRSGFSIDASATDPDGDSVTFSLVTGALPTGMNLSQSTGQITGTPSAVVSDQAFNFTIGAEDSVGNQTQKSFSVTIKAPQSQVYSYTGTPQSFAAPAGLTRFTAYMWGAGGSGGSSQGGAAGGDGGAGGFIKADIANFSDSQSFGVLVGQSAESDNSTAIRAYGGGGNGGAKLSQRIGGSGGGRSEIAIGWTGGNIADGTRVLVAGGGGGGNALYETSEGAQYGGAGGGLTGGSGRGSPTVPTGGTQSAGGSAGSDIRSTSAAYAATAGSAGIGGYATGGNVEVDVSYGAGGGGGGGYYGGGGGDGGVRNTSAQSGAGGSSYANSSYCSSIVNTQASGVVAPEKTNFYYGNGAAEGGSGRNGTGSSGTAGGHGRVVIVF